MKSQLGVALLAVTSGGAAPTLGECLGSKGLGKHLCKYLGGSSDEIFL